MADVFISYSSPDREIASRLASRLEQAGWSVWWDREILFGLPFDAAIEDALRAASCVVVLWSASSVKSDWVRVEASEGKRRGVLVPVLIEETSIPLEFRRIQTASLIGWPAVSHAEEFAKLLRAIETMLRLRLPSGGEATSSEPPSAGQPARSAPLEESLESEGYVAVQKLLSNTYDRWLGGALSHLSRNPAKVAKTRTRDEFIDYLNGEKGTWLRAALRARRAADDEFLVVAEKPYVMTSRSLYVFRTGKVSGPVAVIRLADVESYTTKGWWTKTLCFVLKSGETIEVPNMESVLREEYVLTFLSPKND